MTESTLVWDYVIIGAGSAGSAVAFELLKNPKLRILLLEAGPDNRSIYIRIPTLVVDAVKRYDWGYQSEPDVSRAGRKEAWARGKVLGGSSSINGMMYVRGAHSDFDRWASMQLPGWSWDDVAPIFKDLENSDQPGDERGHQGPLAVRTVKRPHLLTKAFLAAANHAGLALNPDYNGASQGGVGLAQLSQRRGLRFSAADAFLLPQDRNDRLTVWTNCLVERLFFEGGHAKSVWVQRNGERQEILAKHFVLSGGAIGSPMVLLRSGVGDPADMARLGIKPAINSPNVGKNMIEHPLVRLVHETTIASNNLTGGWFQKARFLSEFLLYREGLISTVFEGAGFLKSRPDLSAPDLQMHFLPFGVQDPLVHVNPRCSFPSVTTYLNLSYPTGRGRISLCSSDPAAAPIIVSNLIGSNDDRNALVRGIKLVRTIFGSEPLSGLIKREVTPGPEFADEALLATYLPAHTEIAYHVAGSCRMGSDPGAVVSSSLKLNGADNVWIADASIMPDLISGNTNAVCMMIGMKLGRALANGKAAKI